MGENKAGWKIIEEKARDSFQIFNTRLSTRINPRSGKPFTFFLMQGLDWVNVIALTSKEEVILVRQYRHGAEEFQLEIPGGCVEPGEDPAQSALRELKEETGYISSKIEKLGTLYANPALQSMRLHVFIVRDVELKSNPTLDLGEDIKVEVIPLRDVKEMILNGSINHALVVAAFGLFGLGGS